VGLYEGNNSERGLLALKALQPGDELMRIPLRIALTDHPEDEASNSMLYQGAPWSVRLAAKVLRERALGAGSPWRRYIAVLPAGVPSPLNSFSWDEMQEVQYQPARNAIYEADWLAADAYDRCGAEAIGSASAEEFRWAMSVVHSRTFGSASKKGGVGVRMLVPLIDMINHAGDWGGAINRGKEYVAQDIAAWELLPPDQSSCGAWEMVVKAIRPVEEGDEITMSYGERENDDFLVHYGFVPDGNPHDSVVLFAEGVEEGVEWFIHKMRKSWKDLDRATLKTMAKQARQAADKSLDDGDIRLSSLPAQALHAGRVDTRLLTAFQVLATHLPECSNGGGSKPERAAAQAVAARCWELLHAMPTSLEQDLSTLAALETDPHADSRAVLAAMQQQCRKLSAEHKQAGGSVPGAGRADTAARGAIASSLGSLGSSDEDETGAYPLAVKFRAYKKLILWELMVDLGPPTLGGE